MNFTDPMARPIHTALERAGIDPDADSGIHVTTDTVPWNANRWAYHRRTRVTPMATDPTRAQAIADALQDLDGAAEVIGVIGQPKLRPHVVVIWERSVRA